MANKLGSITINETSLTELDASPALGSGFAGEIGDQAFDTTTGVQYSKFGAGATDWAPALVTRFEITATTLSGTKTLTSISSWLQVFTGTATGYSIVLPDATTLVKGHKFELVNQSSQSITVKTNGGSTLFTLSQTSIGFVTLQDNATAAGTWIFWQVFVSSLASGILNYSVVSSTLFQTGSSTDVIITGMTVTPQAGTYAIWYNASASVSNANRTVTKTIYRGASGIADSIRTNTPPNANQRFIMSTMTVANFDGTQAAAIYTKISSGTLSVNDRSMILIRLGA